MSIDKATRQWSSTDSASDITVSKLEASEDQSAEALESRGRPTTRNQSKLDKAKRSKSNPGTEEQNLSHTIKDRQASFNTSKGAGNNTKGHNSTHLTTNTSPVSTSEAVSDDVESSSSVDRKRKQPQSNQLKALNSPLRGRNLLLDSGKILSKSSVSHDEGNMMFKVDLDDNGSLAAICYLPSRFRGVIEFYHTEIPTKYRSAGVGDLLADCAFQWAEANGLLVIPTCPFIQRHLKQLFPNDQGRWTCVVQNEQEALARFASMHTKPSSSSTQDF